MRNGLIAGSIAAIAAALVSLPLRSPVDNVFNTATVVIAALVVGIAAGLLWDTLASSQRRLQSYLGGLAIGLVVVAAAAVVGNAWLERFASFTIPLAVIGFAVPALLIPNLHRIPTISASWSAPALVVIAVVVGIGLVGQGDSESGDLSLPERVTAPAATQTPAPTLAPTPEQAPGLTTEQPVEKTPEPTDEPAPVETLRYVVTDGSEITFTVGEQLSRLPLPNDAVMRTKSLSGELNLDGQPSVITVNLLTLTSDQDFRDRYTRRTMFADSPTATFTVSELGELPSEFLSGETFSHQVIGVLSVNGIDVPMTFDLEVRNDGDVLNVLGRTNFTWEEFQIPVPTARSVVSVDDEVSVQLLLVAARQ
ncbi:MAG: YceI family protein [Chloroflexi bacterium]|nr:YceI family protein [Chloroflexota bacterium]